jgi:uncharacterized membrane protein YeaQ/YmgE (transglycosylase-associated protein family)
MFNLLVWFVYGLLVGSISKSLVPGEENFGFWKTIALGVCGSYCGGALSYMLGFSSTLEPGGIFLGVGGAVLSIVVYNKLTEK